MARPSTKKYGLPSAALLAAAVTALAPAAIAGEATPAQSASCTLQSGGYRTVARVIDGETLLLDDGRAVRLIGAMAPRASDAGAAAGAWPIETDAIRALTALTLGRSVKLAFGDRSSDRYGRLLAHVFVGTGADEKWVQGELLAAGAARAYGLPGLFSCSDELLAHERSARMAKRGVWRVAIYRIKPADKTGVLMQRRSQYEIVSGTIADVSPTKSATYLNFGRDWKSDFTARIAKDVLAAHPDFAAMLAGLKGKRVAVRGWIERRNGPLIDVLDPSQIDVFEKSVGEPQVSEDLSSQKTTEPASTPLSAVPTPREETAAEEMPGDDDDTSYPKQNRPADSSRDQPGGVDL